MSTKPSLGRPSCTLSINFCIITSKLRCMKLSQYYTIGVTDLKTHVTRHMTAFTGERGTCIGGIKGTFYCDVM